MYPKYDITEGRVESTVLELAILLGEGARLTEAVEDEVLIPAPGDPVLLPHLLTVEAGIAARTPGYPSDEEVDCSIYTTGCKHTNYDEIDNITDHL